MKVSNYLLIFGILLLLTFSSCSENAEVPRGEFADGVIVVNEGNFSEANGSVGFFNEDNLEVTVDLFAKANGVTVGGLIQSVYYHDNKAFIIDNGGSKIHVVDSETFESVATIESGLSSPRYMTVLDGVAYVSNWGPFDENFGLSDSFVAIINLETFEVTGSIPTDSGSEGLIAYGGKIYVANSFTTTIDVIDPGSASVDSQITVEWGPQSFQEDKNGKIWLLSSAFIGTSYLSGLDLSRETVINTIAIADYAKALQINGAGDMLYYLSAPFGSDTEVYAHSIEATEASTEPIITEENIYGLGVHPETGALFLANHNGFQANGTALIFNGSELQSTFVTGVGPNGFVFR